MDPFAAVFTKKSIVVITNYIKTNTTFIIRIRRGWGEVGARNINNGFKKFNRDILEKT